MSTYLITGTSRGIGLSLATHLSTQPSTTKIFAAARAQTPALKDLVKASKGKVEFVELDVTDAGSVGRSVGVVEGVLRGMGRGLDGTSCIFFLVHACA